MTESSFDLSVMQYLLITCHSWTNASLLFFCGHVRVYSHFNSYTSKFLTIKIQVTFYIANLVLAGPLLTSHSSQLQFIVFILFTVYAFSKSSSELWLWAFMFGILSSKCVVFWEMAFGHEMHMLWENRFRVGNTGIVCANRGKAIVKKYM